MATELSLALCSRYELDEGNEIPKDIKNLLHTLPFFAGLTESQEFIDAISKTLGVRTNKPGDVIIRQGETARAMFFIIKGSLTIISEDGEIEIAELSSGSYCRTGHVLFVECSPHSIPISWGNWHSI